MKSSDKAIQKTSRTSILVIYTGGTIGMYEDPETGALCNFDFNRLTSFVPELKQFNFDIRSYTFSPPIDSSDMSPKHWARIVRVIYDNYARFDGFVVLHGTDTMAYTASALSYMLENLSKPVVLTGSQLPVGTIRTDGKENLLTALEIAAAKDEKGHALVPEVCIFFQNRLMRGNRTTKINAEGFNAFRSFNYPLLGKVGIHLHFERQNIHYPDFDKCMVAHYHMDTHLATLSLFPGIRREIIQAVFHVQGIKAIVLTTYGSGNAPQKSWLTDELKKAYEKGIVVINITQCSEGSVEMGRYVTGLQLLQVGVMNGYDSTIESIVTKLMYLMGLGYEGDNLRKKLSEAIAGEMTVK